MQRCAIELSLEAVDKALSDVAQQCPGLKKEDFADPPLAEKERNKALAGHLSDWLGSAPMLRVSEEADLPLTEQRVREFCPEDRHSVLEAALVEVQQEDEEEMPEGGEEQDPRGPEGRTTGGEDGSSATKGAGDESGAV